MSFLLVLDTWTLGSSNGDVGVLCSLVSSLGKNSLLVNLPKSLKKRNILCQSCWWWNCRKPWDSWRYSFPFASIGFHALPFGWFLHFELMLQPPKLCVALNKHSRQCQMPPNLTLGGSCNVWVFLLTIISKQSCACDVLGWVLALCRSGDSCTKGVEKGGTQVGSREI